MIKLPVKDPDTIPWMSKREIPAIKAVLSAWRAMRRDREQVRRIRDFANITVSPCDLAAEHAMEVAWDLELLTAIDERLRKEARDAK